jgi:hypothetical protein
LLCNNVWCPFAMPNIKHLTFRDIVQCAKHRHHKGVLTPPHHCEWKLRRHLANGSIGLKLP